MNCDKRTYILFNNGYIQVHVQSTAMTTTLTLKLLCEKDINEYDNHKHYVTNTSQFPCKRPASHSDCCAAAAAAVLHYDDQRNCPH